ncbi:hypothetical protein [uncultured Sphingomonas sp.]|uniref:hypothetical protein n=1 Tax=uncultured Sphingomonas sp. TaxID=158754 RepID=UPI0025CDFE47|nr:hypothetical protein [uncultured Sphingomonas sp.]
MNELWTVLAAVTLSSAGPIAKFQSRPPLAEYDSAVQAGDVERCLIDLPQAPAPSVYRQPDRPDDVMLIWFKAPEVGGAILYRVDLHRTATGTHVRSWMPAKQVAECAPKAG